MVFRLQHNLHYCEVIPIHIIANIDPENLLTKNASDKTPLELAWQNQQTQAVVGLLAYPSHTANDVNVLIVNYKKNSILL